MIEYAPALIAATLASAVYLVVYVRSRRAKHKRQSEAMFGGYRPR